MPAFVSLKICQFEHTNKIPLEIPQFLLLFNATVRQAQRDIEINDF
jgi:hypothetical protein